MGAEILIDPIGVIHSCYTDKFGIPRQPGLVASAPASIELFEPYNRDEMVKGLEVFSHIWVQFLFHDTVEEGWKPTVRPPRLGGQKRVGVFATRSPHRPNHLGLSVVRFLRIRREGKQLFLEIAGGDFLNKTPVVDVKPYISYSDRVMDSSNGYVRAAENEIEVSFTDSVFGFCQEYQKKTGRDLQTLIVETLKQDPRPASQRQKDRSFGMLLWDINIRWQARGVHFQVIGAELS